METIDPFGWIQGQASPRTVLIVVNQPISQPELFRAAWASCENRAVLDGAADMLRDFDDQLRPDFIIGDCDSITDATRDFYISCDVPVIVRPSQYMTDFGKAMVESKQRWPDTQQFLAFNGLGGRVDHSMHSILCLGRSQREHNVRLLLHSHQNMSFMVWESAVVKTPRNVAGPACGIAPVYGQAHITTHGLMYDVENWETSFQTRVSTSNYLEADEIKIETTAPVLVTVEIKQSDLN